MTLRRYLIIMAIAAAFCWLAFLMVLVRVDPNSAGSIGFALFYLALFFALWGTLNLAGFFSRYLILRHTTPFHHVGISLRQAFWFAAIIVLSLILVVQELFIWWMGLLLILSFTILEGFFLLRRHHLRQRQHRQQQHSHSDSPSPLHP